MISFRVGRWTVELMVVNGLLLGFSLPKQADKPRLFIVNIGPVAICCFRDLVQ